MLNAVILQLPDKNFGAIRIFVGGFVLKILQNLVLKSSLNFVGNMLYLPLTNSQCIVGLYSFAHTGLKFSTKSKLLKFLFPCMPHYTCSLGMS